MTTPATVNHPSPRRRTHLAIVLIATFALGIGLGVALVHASHDIRLDEAMMALQKAAALVEASQSGGVTAHTQHEFDRHLGKALGDIQDAMDHIAAAAAAVDAEFP
jgi:hypothetical protein